MSDLNRFDNTDHQPLSPLEVALIKAFRALSERQQLCLVEVAEALNDHSD